MDAIGARRRGQRSTSMVLLNILLAFVFVSAERGLKSEFSRLNGKEGSQSNFLQKAANFLWQSDASGYQHVWPVKKKSLNMF